ncbi:hypothetical protein JA1_004340 [Spathaspora sp. JA1]|nr:hypothetical protein JA1_004340 [Spathaspora sp. JA1]
MRHQRQFCTVSPCRQFVATTKTSLSSLVEIQNTATKAILTTFNINQIVSNHLKIKNTTIVISQLQWEHTLPNNTTKLLAIVIDNHSLVVILDITQLNPIIIRQTRHDGIEKCQWVPPVDTEQQEGAYTNSRQIVIFTKHNLSLKVYSLDCTHILYTIEKPILDTILIRPNHNNRFWSILGNTREYNSPPVLYHFYNHGSTSVLLHKVRLPHPFITPPQITWSDSGNWISIFSDDETLFGYHLMVYSMLGIVQQGTIGPIIDVDCFTEYSPDLNGKYVHTWYGENLLISRIAESSVKIQVVSMSLLRVVKEVVLGIPSFVQGWKQEVNRVVYNQFATPNINELNQVLIQEDNIFIILNNSLILYYKILPDFQFEFKTIISTYERIIDITTTESELIICTNSQVLLYNMNKSILESLFKSFTKISRINYINQELTVFYDQMAHWQVIRGKNNEALVLKKRNLLNSVQSDEPTITDTFNIRKRLRPT